MIVRYFVDTGAFYAFKDPSDKYHLDASAFMEKVKKDSAIKLVTSGFIIDETLTLIRMRLGYEAAVKFGGQIRESKVAEVIHVSAELEDKAWQIFVKYSDKDYSFTDCTSFAIMEEEGIKSAFAFDGHFSQHGFIMVPKLASQLE